MKKLIGLITLSSFIASCAPNPVVVNIEQSKDLTLNCEELMSELTVTEDYKKAARADDHFKLRYTFLPTGAIAAYRFNKAEGNADKRIQHLQKIANHKKCSLPSDNGYMNSPINNNFDYKSYK